MYRDNNHLLKVELALLILLLSFTFFSFRFQKNTSVPEPYALNYPAYFGNRFTIPADNPTTKEGVYLGRKLFYETRLSRGNQFSCASCHQQKRAFADETSLSMGIGGLTPRNSMTLANLLWVRNFFWDGRAASLEAQAVIPLTDQREMGQSLAESVIKLKNDNEYIQLFDRAFGFPGVTEDRIVKAIAQFERTLISSNSTYDKYLKGEYKPTEQELRGMNLFMTSPSPINKVRGANCAQCHGTPRLHKELFHNNGLDSTFKDKGRMAFTGQDMDQGRFRVPTLRNIAVTAPYMHDGRLKTLEEVVDHYNEHILQSATLSSFILDATNEVNGKTLSLTRQEKQDIVSFLHMLTDSTFITNPEFADPRLQNEKP